MKWCHSKRLFDITISLSACLILWPVFFIIALIVLVRDGWPVIFAHERAGLAGQAFVLYKFRTMAPLSDKSELDQDTLRITRLGNWLRHTSLDELPQLWNVIKGDMSLVGPRPLPMAYVDRYNSEQKERLSVLPGITGWAQVNGRNALNWDEKFALDVWYVGHCSFWLDMKILVLTVVKVMQRKAIVHGGTASGITMPEFMGSKRQCYDREAND